MVRYLCGKFGPDKYDLDSTAQNCLHWASREGHPKVVRYLIEQQGFDPSLMDRVSVCGTPVRVSVCVMLRLSATLVHHHIYVCRTTWTASCLPAILAKQRRLGN